MITNIKKFPSKKLESVKSYVYSPQNDWFYSHHPHITFFNGRFVAIWSNGHINEDDLGQRIMIADSADGEKWENVRPLITPKTFGDESLVLTAAGFHIFGDTLNVYYGKYNYKTEALRNSAVRPVKDSGHTNTDMGYISTTDCINWTSPKSMGIALIPNFGPQATSTGRLIISGNVMFPYTDNPNGVDGYNITGIYGDYFGKGTPVDDSETIHHITKHNKWDARLICEGSFFETDDKVLHMMLRSNTVTLWHSESRDDGKTWSEPKITGFTDDGSKFHFGRLPDGRYYSVSNSLVRSKRLPLDLYVSEDGEHFTRHFIVRDEPYTLKAEGLYKDVVYGYPHTLVKDGIMYVIYSVGKESIEVTKFSIEQL